MDTALEVFKAHPGNPTLQATVLSLLSVACSLPLSSTSTGSSEIGQSGAFPAGVISAALQGLESTHEALRATAVPLLLHVASCPDNAPVLHRHRAVEKVVALLKQCTTNRKLLAVALQVLMQLANDQDMRQAAGVAALLCPWVCPWGAGPLAVYLNQRSPVLLPRTAPGANTIFVDTYPAPPLAQALPCLST